MYLTLQHVADHPEQFTETLITTTGERFVLRPLVPDDVSPLTTFLKSLSTDTRRFSSFDSYDATTAREMCDAIAKYDKLRFVLSQDDIVAGLLELSFDLVDDDMQRYQAVGVPLSPETDCRFGITITDACQGRGLGKLVIPELLNIARRFGQTRVILWGGVLADNARAIHVYEQCEFRRIG